MRQEEKNSLLNLAPPTTIAQSPPSFPLILSKFSCPPAPSPPLLTPTPTAGWPLPAFQ